MAGIDEHSLFRQARQTLKGEDDAVFMYGATRPDGEAMKQLTSEEAGEVRQLQDQILGEHLGDHVPGVLGTKRRDLEFPEPAIDPDAGGGPDLAVQVRPICARPGVQEGNNGNGLIAHNTSIGNVPL